MTRSPDAADVEAVLRMLDAQAHRGPDDWGLLLPESLASARAVPSGARSRDHVRRYADAGARSGAVLGARRLSIVDLSSRGRMPMGTSDRCVWVVHNGEVYNYRELRDELAAREPFHSETDTEAILRGHAAWGDDVVQRLRGMFAFALPRGLAAAPTPSREGSVRDQARSTTHEDAERVIFASEVRALRHSGLVPDEPNPAAFVRFLQLGSVPSPETTVRGVRALPAGHRLTVDSRGSAVRRYWDAAAVPPADAGAARAEDGAVAERTRALLDESVKLHLVSDAPLGIFLSGGVDSSALVALASRHRDAPLTTVSVGFDEPAYSEAAQARLVARQYGTDHAEIILRARDVFAALPRFFRAMDEPTIDGVNTYFVSAAARQAGITVALSGTGGDEVFWGYPHLRRAALLDRLRLAMAALPRPARRGVATAARWVGAVLRRRGLDRLDYLERPSPAALYLMVRGLYRPRQVSGLLGISPSELDAYGPPLPDPARAPGSPPGRSFELQEFGHYLQNQLLKDTDLMSMAHSVEARVPFLDHRLVEYVASLPARAKLAGGPHKPLLLRAMGGAVPREVWDRPKMGFTFPLAPWMAQRAAELRAQSLEGGRLDARAVGQVWDDFEAGRVHWSRPWALVVLSRLESERGQGGGVSARRPGEVAGPAAPWVVIDAERATRALEPSELWRYRDLLYFLTWRDVAVRYKQTLLGFLWAVIQPLASMVVFTVFLGSLAGVPSDGIPYPVFAYLGLLPWTYFAAAVTRGGASLVGNAHLLTRVYFPRVLVPLSAALAALVDFAIALSVLGALLAWYGLRPAPTVVLLVPLTAVMVAAAAGVGMWLGALNARYRDVQHAVPFLMQLWMFATPVVYPASIVPAPWRPWLALNPMAGLVESYRAAALGRPLDWLSLGISVASAATLAALGLWQFQRMQRFFADVV